MAWLAARRRLRRRRPGRRDRRRRHLPDRPAHGFDFLPDGDGPESLAAHSSVVGAELSELTRLVRYFLAGFGSLEEPWQRAAAFDSYALTLTSDELVRGSAVARRRR